MSKFIDLYNNIINECNQQQIIDEGFWKSVKHLGKSITGNPEEKIRLINQVCQEYNFKKNDSKGLSYSKEQDGLKISLHINSDDGLLKISVEKNNKKLVNREVIKISNGWKTEDLLTAIEAVINKGDGISGFRF